jgi:hypothetical protein
MATLGTITRLNPARGRYNNKGVEEKGSQKLYTSISGAPELFNVHLVSSAVKHKRQAHGPRQGSTGMEPELAPIHGKSR